MSKKLISIVLAMMLTLGVAGAIGVLGITNSYIDACTNVTDVNGEDGQSIVEVLEEDGRFTTLISAIEAAGLTETLSGEGPFTVFAPTDDAFNALPEGTLDELLADIPALTDVLLYHVVEGEVMAADLVGMTEVVTLQGQSLTISVSNDDVMVNDAKVVEADIIASNGVIHVIDAVLIP